MQEAHYDVAISFAGEDRARAEELAIALRGSGIRTFYDAQEKADLWGKDLYAHLTDLYGARARFCLMLVSRHYAAKDWTIQERRAAQARAMSQDIEYILPVRLDGAEIPGLLPTTAYLSWPPETADSIVESVLFKLRQLDRTMSTEQLTTVKSSHLARPTIRQFQLSLEKIYRRVNSDRSLEYMYGYLSRTVGYLSKAVSQKQAEVKDFIRPVSWLFTLASKVGIDVEDAFISRYPKLCPSCVQPQCVCFRTNKQPPKYIPAYLAKEELLQARDVIINQRSAITFDFAKVCVSSVFPNNEIIWYYAGSGFHFSKIAEEVAEVHEAISGLLVGKKKLGAVSDEIADVLAWLLGAWHIALGDKSVDQEIISYYIHGCPVCQLKTCSCNMYSGRAQNLFDVSVLADVGRNLADLMELEPDNKAIIEELQRSVKVVIETHDDPLARLTLHQIEMQLNRIRDASVGKECAAVAIPIISVILKKLEKSYRQ